MQPLQRCYNEWAVLIDMRELKLRGHFDIFPHSLVSSTLLKHLMAYFHRPFSSAYFIDMAPSLNALTDKAASYAEVLSLYLAQASGAFFGVFQGLMFVCHTLLSSVSQLRTTDGRKQILYGREGPTQGKSETFEGGTSFW